MRLFLITFPGVALGFLLILGLIARWLLVVADQKRTELLLVVAIFTAVLSGVAQAIANKLSVLRPLKYDLYIYQLAFWRHCLTPQP